MDRSCLECDAHLSGRIDKKFCSDYCRNTYNNKQNSDSNKLVRSVNNVLRKNRKILALMNTNKKTTVSAKKLKQAGFNFYYFTNVYETRKGAKYFFCYDQGYLPLANDNFTLVEKQDYV